MTIQVVTGISGSFCVVYHTKEHYLDCRNMDMYTQIVCVRNGFVYRTINESNGQAPKTIIKTIREEFLY